MSELLLDTHIWFWFVSGDNILKKELHQEIESAKEKNSLFISAISPWEISMLSSKKKIKIFLPCLEWINESIEKANVKLLPISPSVAVESCHLPGQFHADPADQIIVATARVHNLTLVTRDQKIIDYSKQEYVRVLPCI